MHEFETFVYLDVQKTGSTYIYSVLRKFSVEKEIRTKLHLGVEDESTNGKLHFISIRNPLDQYISLYSFGCQASGNLFKRLHARGLGDLYDGTWSGFRHWLDFMLDTENRGTLTGEYGSELASRVSAAVGLLSYRALTLAMRGGRMKLADCNTRDEIISAYRENNIVDITLRTESLRSDLVALLTGRLQRSISDAVAAVAFVESSEALNASDRVDQYESKPKLGKNRRQRLVEREWPLYELFGY